MNERSPETTARLSPEERPAANVNESMAAVDLWSRIKEHKVLQWGLGYLGAALAVAHGADLLGHAFVWPEVLNRLVLGMLILGFPIALAVAWYHGHRSLKSISAGEATIIALLVVIGAGLLVRFVRAPAEPVAENIVAAHSVAAPNGATAHPTSASVDGGPSIAVLPFVNMSADPDQEYFSDGLSEELLNTLSQAPNLRVIGRTSSFAFKGKNEDLRTIGETLGVNRILEGSVRKSIDQLRITAQLIDPADGSHLWSGTYDRKLGDVFEIQEDIARTVALALRASIQATNLGEGGTHNIQAYDEFLRASATNGGVDPIPRLERATALDPQFAQAWAALALSYAFAHSNSPDPRGEYLEKSRAAEDHVLALAPHSAVSDKILAGRQYAMGNLLETERLLKVADTLPAGFGSGSLLNYGSFLQLVGRCRDALPVLESSYENDPLSSFTWLQRQLSYQALGRFEQAEADQKRALSILPDKEIVYLAIF